MSLSSTVLSVHDQIASQLRADVRSGVYQPGDRIREGEIAERFGVSRSPVRQVLQELTREGLLYARPNCGTVVADAPSKEVMQVLRRCRAELECIALRQCFDELDEADFREWERIMETLYNACDREDYIHAYYQDSLFHALIMEKAAPAGSRGVYGVINNATAEYVSVDCNRPYHSDFREVYAMHASLFAIYRMGDLELACEALYQHILREPFVQDSYQCWMEAGKPRKSYEIYEPLAKNLRKAINRTQKK
ncbi:MAG: GntR family transcriptional regulator [Planctomycetaceae bacterium]